MGKKYRPPYKKYVLLSTAWENRSLQPNGKYYDTQGGKSSTEYFTALLQGRTNFPEI
jgi:hypothetical protein